MLAEMIRRAARLAYRATTVGLAKGPHVTRYYMYQHLSTFSAPRPEHHKVLSISHSERLATLIGYRESQISEASYPDFNILSLPFSNCEFDAVVSDQVLEHVEGDPQVAIDETFRVLKPNGIALHTTCFMNQIHGSPGDFWRFTPEALKLLVRKHAVVIDCGGWGNPYVWILEDLGLRYEPIPDARWHPAHWLALKNTETWPISTWVLAAKLLASKTPAPARSTAA
jgi:SAM-dependent methyltransferase